MTRPKWILAGLAVALGTIGLQWTKEARFPTADARLNGQSDSTTSAAADRAGSTSHSLAPEAKPDKQDRAAVPAVDTRRAVAGRPAAPDSSSPTPDSPDWTPPDRLDSAKPAVIRAALNRAVEQARRTRALQIAPEIIETAAQDGSVRVIFETAPSEDMGDLARTLDSGGRSDSVEDLRVFPLLGHGAASLSPGALLNLIAETSTHSIEPDDLHRASLLQSVPQIGASVAQADTYDGNGFAVAVIDTGVDADHPMFGTRVIEEACFSLNNDCPNAAAQMLGAGAAAPCALAGCDHGTHVAGIAVGDADSGPLVGVAPNAGLIAINVFSDIEGEPGAYTSDILAAMQHVLALSAFHDIAAVNLSLGGEAYTSAQSCSQASPSQINAVNQLRNAGIATIAASGNESLTNAIASPACLSNVISVGSVSGSDVPSPFSNSADFLSVLAPGESIQSAAVGGGTRNGSGTSMATPHVAGAVAAIREAFPGASVDAIENALALSGQAVLDNRNGITTPRVRVDQAIAILANAGPPSGGGGSAASASGGGGGGGCGLIGIEPFLVLAVVRRRRTRRPA